MPDGRTLIYFKRFRMEIDLTTDPPAGPGPLPPPLTWAPWEESLLDRHASAKFESFRDELDTQVFPSLGHPLGCHRLMREIRRKPGFLPEATWLIDGPDGPVATIQGVIDRGPIGAIQNVGVVRAFRGRGLGQALVLKSLQGFRAAGLERVFLEVTADNEAAVRLYRAIGFRRSRTLYRVLND
jgi:ribosomal protein S18 acetylase RimI-like enzyme